MYKVFAMMTAALLFLAVSPLVNADHGAQAESVDGAYLTSSGAGASGVGYAAITICPDSLTYVTDPDWDPVNDPLGDDLENPYGCSNPEPNIPHMGSAKMFTKHGEYSILTGSIEDDIFGSEAANSVCLWNPEPFEGTTNCSNRSGTHESSGPGCGTQTVFAEDENGDTFYGVSGTIFVFVLYVTEDLSVCGGSSGTVVGEFSNP